MKIPFLFLLIVCCFSGHSQVDSLLDKQYIIDSNLEFRKEMNEYFSNPDKSPLPLFRVDEFKEAPYHEIKTDYAVVARFEVVENGRVVKMKTSTDRIAEYRIFGRAYFKLLDDSLSLYVYKAIGTSGEEHLFLPFKDLSNGKDSYSAGRYLDIDPPIKGKLVIDFNKSYNPSCAYSNRYSCPRVPIDNHLNVSVDAGAKYIKHEDGWNELDKQPSYTGSIGADLGKYLKYPKKSRKKKIEGVVYVKMIVNKDGSLSNFEIAKGFNEECDQVAVQACKKLKAFQPAEKNNQPVRSFVILPISFKL